MKHSIFNTRQRAEELLREAVAVWESGNNSDVIEGIDKDPVFSLLLTALAYQENEIDSEIDQLRGGIIDQFSRMLVPFEHTHAVPATAAVKIEPGDRTTEFWVDSNTVFTAQDGELKFMPLLRTKIINAEVISCVRMDNRRWKVVLKTNERVENLSGLAFIIDSQDFSDLKITCEGSVLPLVKPWDYADLPLSNSFSLNNMLYSASSVFSMTNIGADLFAGNNIRLFYIDAPDAGAMSLSTDRFELIFEFSGIKDDFVLNRQHLILNANILANASKNSVTLSPAAPAARISSEKGQFLQLIRPASLQILREEPVILRRVDSERFSPDHLLRIVETMLSRYHSDYYAFKQMESSVGTDFMEQLSSLFKRLSTALENRTVQPESGIYAILKDTGTVTAKETSLELEYLTTDGSKANDRIRQGTVFYAQGSPQMKSATALSDPAPGRDEIKDADAMKRLSRYYMTTRDRIVTPADVKIFCYNELASRFGLTSDIIRGIRVKNVTDAHGKGTGLSTAVYIDIADEPMVRRSFQPMIPQAEIILEKMIQVRTVTVFPVSVTITLK